MASHLTFEERAFLHRLKMKGKYKAKIAQLMERDRSTIYRELRRNTGGHGYRLPSLGRPVENAHVHQPGVAVDEIEQTIDGECHDVRYGKYTMRIMCDRKRPKGQPDDWLAGSVLCRSSI
jgi:IS30 family transposase